MKRIIIILSLCMTLFVWNNAEAGDWTKEDTLREVAYGVVHVIDWSQTAGVAGEEGEFTDKNPVISGLSKGEVNTYFAATLAGHYLISRALPPKYRKPWQYITFTLQSTAVMYNFSMGISVDW